MMTTKEFLTAIIKKFSANIGTIHWLNPGDNFLYLVAYTEGLPSEMLAAIRRISLQKESITSTTVRNKEPMIIQNLSTSTQKIIRPLEQSIGVATAICLPIFKNEIVVGALGIGFSEECLFTSQETNNLLDTVRNLADILIVEQGHRVD